MLTSHSSVYLHDDCQDPLEVDAPVGTTGQAPRAERKRMTLPSQSGGVPPSIGIPDDTGLGSQSRGNVSASSTRTRSKRALLNSIAAGLDYAALTAVDFVITPLLIAGLGRYLYGAWRVLWKLTGYLWATTGRAAPALQSAIANRQSSEDSQEKRELVGSAIVVALVFLPLLAMVGGVGAWFAPRFLRTPPEYVGAVRLAAGLLVADSLALTLLSIPRAVLQGENLGYKRMGLSALLVLMGGALTALALYLDTGIGGVAVANLANTVLTAVLFWKVTRAHVPWFGLAKPSRRVIGRFFRLSWWFTIWKFVNELITTGDVVLLGLFAPLELVAVYTLTKYVPDAITGFLAKPLQGVAPGLGGIIGAGDFGRAIRVRNEFMSLTWLVAAAAGAVVLLWNESFVSLWVGPGYYAGSLPTLLIVVMALQFALLRNDAYFIDLTLNVRAKVLLGILSTIISVTLGALLVGAFDLGIMGLCAAFIAGRLTLTLSYPWLAGRSIDHPFGAQLRGASRAFITTALLFTLTLILGRHLRATSWMDLLLSSALSIAGLGLMAVFAGLTSSQRAALWARMRRVFRMASSMRGE